MSVFYNSKSGIIVQNLIDAIHNSVPYLSEVDGAIGDGDHGINMDKGFLLTRERLAGKEVSFSEALKTLGRVLVMEIGGSMGPIYGTLFIDMAKVLADKEEIDAETFRASLKKAYDGVYEIGNAQVGDKTMLDCLHPAVEAYNKALDDGKTFEEALNDLIDASEKGKEATKDMVAKVGRASRLGERSRGVLDAGATSCNIILQTIAKSIKNLL